MNNHKMLSLRFLSGLYTILPYFSTQHILKHRKNWKIEFSVFRDSCSIFQTFSYSTTPCVFLTP